MHRDRAGICLPSLHHGKERERVKPGSVPSLDPLMGTTVLFSWQGDHGEMAGN